MPTERYCAAPEILGHSKLIAEKYGLYDKAVKIVLLRSTKLACFGRESEGLAGCFR